MLTKTETMKQLVKQRVSLDDPIRKLVQRELRHVSLTISLDELGRILARNRFALVNRSKFVTTTDLLQKIVPYAAAVDGEAEDSTAVSETAGGPEANEGGASMMKLAATTVAGLGVAALGTFMYMKKQQ